MSRAAAGRRPALRRRPIRRRGEGSPQREQPRRDDPARVSQTPVRGPLLLLVFSLAAVGAGAGRALTTTYVPYLLERIDDAPALIGLVMTVNAVSGFAVPLAVGLWSDRRHGRGLGRRLPFMVAGAGLTIGGLIAIALGTGSSYLALANRAASLALLASTRRWLPDPQNGMRLYWVEALRASPHPEGGYEAESAHLRQLLAAGRRVASVEIPTIYEGEPSHFRPLADTRRVARALLAPRVSGATAPARAAAPARASLSFLRGSWPRLAIPIVGALAIAALLPGLQPLDNAAFSTINGLGDGPEPLYQAFDPHTRNYILISLLALVAGAVRLRRARYVAGTGLALLLAAYLSGAGLELVKLLVERARPEEILGSGVQLSHGRSWAALASFPSGHMVVTAALAAVPATTLPRLRTALIVYVGLVGLTRVLFGAHFPLDVLAGAAIGWQTGIFCAGLVASSRLLPVEVLHRSPEIARAPTAPARRPAT